MVFYKSTNITAKNGLNYVRSVVEGSGSLFHKIEAENDLGIDGIIEFLRDGKPLNEQIAIQLKSGNSYYCERKKECEIPIGAHKEYWLKYPLRVFGVVYIPDKDTAHWVNIKNRIKENSDINSIKFEASKANLLDGHSFKNIFIPNLTGESPRLSFEEAVDFFQSRSIQDVFIGLITLFRRYINRLEVWDLILDYFLKRPASDIPAAMVYFLAHIPWHQDILAFRQELPNEHIKDHVNKYFAKFTAIEVEKLLTFVDENGISRGAIGQSVEAIISSLGNRKRILETIILDNTKDMQIREYAGLILAMNEGCASMPIISHIANDGSDYALQLIEYIKDNDGINPYS